MRSLAMKKIFPSNILKVLCIITSILFVGSEAYHKCLLNKPEVQPKRFLRYNGQSLNITLETSNAVSHQLYTHVFKIFLQEVLGYPMIEIIHEEDNHNIQEIVSRLSERYAEETISGIPRIVINLEVWVPPDFDTASVVHLYNIREYGIIAPPVHFGWFIPLIHDSKKMPFNDQDVHWSLFKDPNYVPNYNIEDESDIHLITSYSFQDFQTKKYYCMDRVCNQGMFTPKQCYNVSCVLLLAPYYEATKFVVDHIKQLKLYVKVVWLGPHLKEVVMQLKNNYRQKNIDKRFLILSWSPSEVISCADNFTQVNFKRCELLKFSVDGYKYDLQRLVKFSSSNLKRMAKVAYHSLYKVKFSEEDYNLLIDLYNKKTNKIKFADVACEWMKQKDSTWRYWIPESTRERNTLYIGGIFPITSSINGRGILQGALMATNAINKNSSLLHDYNLQILVSNAHCKTEGIVKPFIDYIVSEYYNKLFGILSPACLNTAELLVGLGKLYNTLVMSYSPEERTFLEMEKYPYLFRTVGYNQQFKYVYLQMFKMLGWKKVAALMDFGQTHIEQISDMEDLFQKEGITFTANLGFSSNMDLDTITQYLEDLKHKQVHTIIADLSDKIARLVMCEAFKLNMTAKQGYVWFLPYWLNKTWYNTTYFNIHTDDKVDCTAMNLTEAIDGHFFITPAFFAPDEAIMQENITVGEWRRNYKNYFLRKGSSDYAGFAYDAVWAYALALDKLIKEDPGAVAEMHSRATTEKLVNHLRATDFSGVSGKIKFEGDSSPRSVLQVVQWFNNNTKTIGHFHPSDSNVSSATLQLNIRAITWLAPNVQVGHND